MNATGQPIAYVDCGVVPSGLRCMPNTPNLGMHAARHNSSDSCSALVRPSHHHCRASYSFVIVAAVSAYTFTDPLIYVSLQPSIAVLSKREWFWELFVPSKSANI
jgi:hypothetical protein